MMRTTTLGRLLLLIGIVSSVAPATPINYSINFLDEVAGRPLRIVHIRRFPTHRLAIQ